MDDRFQSRRHIQPVGSEPFIWHYLTFDTNIPTHQYAERAHSQLPRCPNLVAYESPTLWPNWRKQAITWTSCLATVLSGFAAGSYSAGFDQMAQEWDVSDVALSVGLTVFTLGIGTAPMVLAPFSEINGRYPVFMLAAGSLVVFQLCCAVTRTYWGMIISRFFAGCASSIFSTVVAGIMSDMYLVDDRHNAMALFSGAALFGSGLGPLVSGIIAVRTSWRWIFYAQVISAVALTFLMYIVLRETRGSVLLSRKAKVLNQWYEELEAYSHNDTESQEKQYSGRQRIRWKVASDGDRASISQMLRVSICRPVHLFFTEPIVFLFSLWISFSWAVLYATFAAVPLVFRLSHDFDVQQRGLVFASMCTASVVSTIMSIYTDKCIRRCLQGSPSLSTPEHHLYMSCVQSMLLPVGCFWFGWTSFPSDPWILPTLAIGCATMGIFSIYLAVFNYLADIYNEYASSALAAQGFCRNLLGGIFLLVIPAMFDGLTFQGAGSLLGILGALLTLVPWVLVAFGPKIRRRSRFVGTSAL